MKFDVTFDFRFRQGRYNYCALLSIDHTNNKAYYMESCQGADSIYTNENSIDNVIEYILENCDISQVDFKDNLAMIEYIENWLLEKQYNEQQKNAYANDYDDQMLMTLKRG